MKTINAQSIIDEVMAAHAIAPNDQGEYRNDFACFWPRFAPWGFEDFNESDSEYPTQAENAYMELIYQLMTHATSEINDMLRAIAKRKAKRKAENKAQANKPHGLQVGDVVRSSWGYDQTNVNHYQIVKVIGKRTVEVRELAEHDEETGNMSGRAAPIPGEFVGDILRRQVDSRGAVNMMHASYGRAYKIEPLTVVHGVRCYPASNYSSCA